MKKYLYNICSVHFVIASILLLSACSTSEEDDRGGYLGNSANNYITWNPNVEDLDGDSRALMNATGLQKACTPTEGADPDSDDGTERVGIWADLIRNSDNGREFFFNNRMLGYYHKDGGREGQNWNYSGDDIPWLAGRKMICRAYYPAVYLTKNDMVVHSSDATSFHLNYSIYDSQEDILVGYNLVDTDSKTDKDNKDVTAGIPIEMFHALSALKFKFYKAEKGSSTKLTSCYLECGPKNDESKSFATVGLLAFGSETAGDENKMVWDKAYEPEAKDKCYEWKYEAGLEFTSTTPAIPYADNQNMYSNNSGAIMIIPQVVPDNLYLCFTTEEGGAYNVTKIPLNTGGELNKDDKDKNLKWLHNKCYTYSIKISDSKVTIEVSITPWNNINTTTGVEL